MSSPAATATASHGALAPFGVKAFAVLWLASVASNIGTWMSSAATGWFMVELGGSPLFVASVQVTSAAPLFLFAVLAGALADIFDRRRLLILMQCAMGIVAAGFAALTFAGAVTPAVLLGFVFLLATGGAFVAPAWQAIVPRLVDKTMLAQAVALNSMGINVARAIGPALAGVLIASAGLAAPFAADALSYLLIIGALLWWRAPAVAARLRLPPEHVGGAVVAGLRYAAHSPAFKATLWRASGFFLFASAAMSLMPTVAQTQLNAEAGGYGLLMGAVGGGAVFGALVLPYLRGGIGPNGRVALGTTIAAAATLGLALADRLALGIASAALFGFGWISVVAALNTAAQFALPDWVRARGLAIFTSVFFGAVAIGGLGWGAVATHFGVDLALIAAGVLAVAVLPLAARARLAETPPDLTPSLHWPDPVVAAPVEGDRGPIMVTIAYRIDPPDLAAALTALSRLESVRRRNGATQWGILQDAADPSALIEYFIESSWAEHLRHHGRVSAADRLLQDAVLAFHRGPDAPVIRHLIAPAPGGAAPEPPNDRTLG